MAGNLGKWPSKRGPISKIRPSDGCGRDAVPSAVERWYDFHEFGCHLENVGQDQRRAVAILDIGRMHDRVEDQTEGIDKQVALLALGFFEPPA